MNYQFVQLIVQITRNIILFCIVSGDMKTNRVVLWLLIAGVVLISSGVAAAEYSLSTDVEQDVPDRNVDFEGDTYTISKISRVNEGGTVQVDASGPSDKRYEVQLRNPDNSIEESKPVPFDDSDGDADLTYNLPDPDNSSPGSWAFVTVQDGDIKKIHPTIIKAYDVSHTGSSTADQGDSFNVTVEVTQLSDEKDINYVQVVLANDIEDVTATATKTNGNYEATISTDSLGTGDYSLYATVRGNKEVRNRDELLGFSDSTTVTIESTSDEEDGDSSGAVEDTPSEQEDDESENETGTVEVDAEPDTTAEAAIEDADADSPGVTVEFEGTDTVDRVTFDDEGVDGSVNVAEYDAVPESVRTAISERNSGNSEESDTSDGATVITVADISPSSESARQSAATIELSVPRSALDTPENAVILHEQPDGTWSRLATDAQEMDDGTVSVQADIESFSLFAVADESAVTPTPIQVSTPTPESTAMSTAAGETATDAATPTETPTPSSVVTPQATATPGAATDTPGSDGAGFTLFAAIAALSFAVIGLRRR